MPCKMSFTNQKMEVRRKTRIIEVNTEKVYSLYSESFTISYY